MYPLSLIFGVVVGHSLGLTGGGGAIFAVPLLVYGLGFPARQAVAISLAAVGTTSFVGFLHRLKLGEVEVRTGLLFAVAGMLGAPVGTWLAGFVPETVLLLAFAGLMVVVAVRINKSVVGSRSLHFRKSSRSPSSRSPPSSRFAISAPEHLSGRQAITLRRTPCTIQWVRFYL